MKQIIYCNNTYITRFEDFVEVVRLATSSPNTALRKRLQQEVNALFRDEVLLQWLESDSGHNDVYYALAKLSTQRLTDTALLNQLARACELKTAAKVVFTVSDFIDYPTQYTILYHGKKQTFDICEPISISDVTSCLELQFDINVKQTANEALSVSLINVCSGQDWNRCPEINVQNSISLIRKGVRRFIFNITNVSPDSELALIVQNTVVAKVQFATSVVDLGLSVLWAKCNLGANKPFEPGDYFAWGEITPKKVYSEGNYKVVNVSDISGNPRLDAATAFNPSFRTPTTGQWEELYNNCDISYITESGVSCKVFVSRINQAKLILPFTGYRYVEKLVQESDCYWSADRYGCDGLLGRDNKGDYRRLYMGLLIRPVKCK